MDQVETAAVEQPPEVSKRERVAERVNLADEVRDNVIVDVAAAEFVRERAFTAEDDMRLVPRAIKMIENAEHGALRAAEERQHLHVANPVHRREILLVERR